MENGVIIGFYGRAGCSYASFVNAIGVYAKPLEDSFCDSTQGLFILPTSFRYTTREAGPWGGITGKQFDDGVFSSTGQVNIFVGDGVVRGIGFLYNTKDGKSVESKRHGGGGRDDEKIYIIKLDCLKEYIVGIMGYFGPVVENAGHEALRFITFYSNKGKYGPFGNEIGTAFSSSISDGKVVGFHGRRPWGGPGGDQHWSFKANVAITEILISHVLVVDSISFASVDENGKLEYSERFGGDGGKSEKESSCNKLADSIEIGSWVVQEGTNIGASRPMLPSQR
ncbi:hypothetical protein Q3G72_011009 [Acer saccharum]|nr:hypothetical protein Q3G72_011009 [Acer saccharum]